MLTKSEMGGCADVLSHPKDVITQLCITYMCLCKAIARALQGSFTDPSVTDCV